MSGTSDSMLCMTQPRYYDHGDPGDRDDQGGQDNHGEQGDHGDWVIRVTRITKVDTMTRDKSNKTINYINSKYFHFSKLSLLY